MACAFGIIRRASSRDSSSARCREGKGGGSSFTLMPVAASVAQCRPRNHRVALQGCGHRRAYSWWRFGSATYSEVIISSRSHSSNTGRQSGRRHSAVVFALKKMFRTDLGLNGIERTRLSSLIKQNRSQAHSGAKQQTEGDICP